MALQVWLPLDGNLDNQGLSESAVLNVGATVDNSGKIGKCYSFDGSSKYISSGYDLFFDSGTRGSFAMWIYPTASNCAIAGSQEWQVQLYIDGGGKLWFNQWNASGANSLRGSSTSIISLNTWTHICFTWNGAEMLIYLNGVVDGRFTANYDTHKVGKIFNIGGNVYMSNVSGASRYFTGKINDVRIYNHCLSAKEVKEISKGLVLHYKLAESDKLNANLVTESEARVTSNGTASTNEYAAVCNTLPIFDTYGLVPYTLSFDIKAAVAHSFSLYGNSGSNPKYTFTQKSINVTTEWQRISYTFTPTLSAENGTWARISVYGVYGSGAIVSLRNVKLELGEIETPFGVDTGIIADVSGYKHNGTVTGNLKLSSNSPRYKSSLYFDGSSYIKTLPGELSWSNFEQLTIAAWMKPTTTPSDYTGSIGIGHDGANGHKAFAMSNYAGKFYLNMTNGSSYVNVNSGYTCPLNAWHHYAVTLTDTTLSMYVDGVVVKTATINFGTAAIHNNPQFQVAVDLPGTDEKYTGYYSDVRIYATALSAEDINDLYHTSAFVDDGQNIETFEFDEVTSDSPNITKSGIFRAQTFTEDTSAEIYTAEVKANQLIEI